MNHYAKPVKLWGLHRPIFLPPSTCRSVYALADPLMQICLQCHGMGPGGCSEQSTIGRWCYSIQRSPWNIKLVDQSDEYCLEGLTEVGVSFYQLILRGQLSQMH